MIARDPASRPRPLLLLIDGSHAVFRAYFAIRELHAPDGTPTHAVFGFLGLLERMLRTWQPTAVAVCMDASERSFRQQVDPRYKANRPPPPEDLLMQWAIITELVGLLGLSLLEDDDLEADDLIATLAVRGRAAGYDVLIASSDKDLMQLVRPADAAAGLGAVEQLDDVKGVVFDRDGVIRKWGVPPEQVADLLALMGDKVDNIPGVRGIGQKGAARLLDVFGSLDGIDAHVDEAGTPRMQRLLREGHDEARLSRRLVALRRDADLPGVSLASLAPRPLAAADHEALAERTGALGFRRISRRHRDEAARLREAPGPR